MKYYNDCNFILKTTNFRHIMRIHIKCTDMRRFGAQFDGGWNFCMAGPFKPEKNNCLIYSVGYVYLRLLL